MQGSVIAPLFLCSNVRILAEGLHEGLQLGVTLAKVRGYTFGVFGGGDREGEKYRIFKIDPRFRHFTMKKKPSSYQFTPY